VSEQSLPTSLTILVVEDDTLLRRAVSSALPRYGFGVIEASNGTAAIDIIEGRVQQIDIILLDFELPGTSSVELFQRARAVHPGARIIITSAQSRQVIDAAFGSLAPDQFLQKPYRMIDLTRLLANNS